MICIEKKDILNGFATIKGKNNNKFLYFHIEVDKSYIKERLTLMVCTNTAKYFVMNLDKDTAEFNTEKKLVFNGQIADIQSNITVAENQISIAVFNDNELIVAAYNVGVSYPIINLPTSKDTLNVQLKTKQKCKDEQQDNKTEYLNISHNNNQDNNQDNKQQSNIEIDKNNNITTNTSVKQDTVIQNDILDEVSLTQNSNKNSISTTEIDNAEDIIQNKDTDKLEEKEKSKEIKEVIPNIKSKEKEENLVPFNLTINKEIDTTKDPILAQGSELIDKMFVRATTSRELKDEPNNMIIFNMTYMNFKKIALNENIYYIPINLIVSMLKKEIKLCERFIITIVFKKNSPYIKCIQVAVKASDRNLHLDNLSNLKYCYDSSSNVGYWVFNYEP